MIGKTAAEILHDAMPVAPKHPTFLWKTAFGALCLMPFLLAATRAGADIALCLIAALFLADSAIRRAWDWTAQPEIRALGGLWAFMLVAAWLTPISPLASFTSALIWGRFVLFFAAMRYWLLRDAGALARLHPFGLLALLLAAADAAWQYQTGLSLSGHPTVSDARLTGPLSHANIGNMLLKIGLPMLGIGFYLAFEARRTRRLWALAAGFLAIIAVITVSGERSTALLTLLSLGILGAALAAGRRGARGWIALSAAGIAALIAALAATQPIVLRRFYFFVEQLSDFWNTPYGQLFIAAWRLGFPHALTGIGPQQFAKVCDREALNVTYCDMHPHNMYVEWLVAAGIPGFCLLLLALGFMLRGLLRQMTFCGSGAVLSAFACAGTAVIVFPFVATQSVFSNWPAALYWYCLGLALSLPQLIPHTAPKPAA